MFTRSFLLASPAQRTPHDGHRRDLQRSLAPPRTRGVGQAPTWPDKRPPAGSRTCHQLCAGGGTTGTDGRFAKLLGMALRASSMIAGVVAFLSSAPLQRPRRVGRNPCISGYGTSGTEGGEELATKVPYEVKSGSSIAVGSGLRRPFGSGRGRSAALGLRRAGRAAVRGRWRAGVGARCRLRGSTSARRSSEAACALAMWGVVGPPGGHRPQALGRPLRAGLGGLAGPLQVRQTPAQLREHPRSADVDLLPRQSATVEHHFPRVGVAPRPPGRSPLA